MTHTCPICGKPRAKAHKTCSFACGLKKRSREYAKNPVKKEVNHCPCGAEINLRARLCAPCYRKRGREVEPEPLTIDEQARHKVLANELKRCKSQLSEALEQRIIDEDYQRFVGSAASRGVEIPSWTHKVKRSKLSTQVPVALFSDWHLDEVVRPSEVRFLNGYNRSIAERRLENYFRNIVGLSHDHLKGVEFPGICVPFLGDNFSGDIHAELRETNAAPLLASLLHWIAPAAAGLKLLAEEFGKVWVPVVVGNHGRTTMKPVYKGRAESNFDWLFAQLLAQRLKDDKRIKFAIPKSHKFSFSIFGTQFLISHGDEAKGGSGIAGALSPLMISDARARKTGGYDYWLCGHWHQRLSFKGIMCNGAGKGYDEYAMVRNLEFRWPEQSYFLVDPRHGVTGEWPIHLLDPKEEWIDSCPRTVPGGTPGAEVPFSQGA